MNKKYIIIISSILLSFTNNLKSSLLTIEDAADSFKESHFQHLPKELVLTVVDYLDNSGFNNFKITCKGAAFFSFCPTLYKARKIRHTLHYCLDIVEDIKVFIDLHTNQSFLSPPGFKDVSFNICTRERDIRCDGLLNSSGIQYLESYESQHAPLALNMYAIMHECDLFSYISDVNVAAVPFSRNELDLSNTSVTDYELKAFAKCYPSHVFQKIILSNCINITPHVISYFKNASIIDLSWNFQISDNDLDQIEGCSGQTLRLARCSLSDEQKEKLCKKGFKVY